jgi:hypothetical protein
MPKSYRSIDDSEDDGADTVDGSMETEQPSQAGTWRHSDDLDGEQTPRSPLWMRRARGKAQFVDENSSLLGNMDHTRTYATRNISTPGTPRTLRTPGIRRQHSYNTSVRQHHRKGSMGQSFSNRLVNALMRERRDSMEHSGMVVLLKSRPTCGH